MLIIDYARVRRAIEKRKVAPLRKAVVKILRQHGVDPGRQPLSIVVYRQYFEIVTDDGRVVATIR